MCDFRRASSTSSSSSGIGLQNEPAMSTPIDVPSSAAEVNTRLSRPLAIRTLGLRASDASSRRSSMPSRPGICKSSRITVGEKSSTVCANCPGSSMTFVSKPKSSPTWPKNAPTSESSSTTSKRFSFTSMFLQTTALDCIVSDAAGLSRFQ